MTDDDQAWLDSARCDEECLDAMQSGRACRGTCDRYIRACEALRRSTPPSPDRRAGFVTRRRASRQHGKNESLQ